MNAQVKAKPEFDRITFEVLRNALATAADEMALMVMRSARSGVVRELLDFAAALCDRDGRLIAQGLSLPLHLLMREFDESDSEHWDLFRLILDLYPEAANIENASGYTPYTLAIRHKNSEVVQRLLLQAAPNQNPEELHRLN